MKNTKIIILISYLLFASLANIINYNIYQDLNSYKYDSMYIYDDLAHTIAIDFNDKETTLNVFHISKTLLAKHPIETRNDVEVKYINSDENVYIYMYNDTYETLYLLDHELNLEKIFETDNKINKDIQYLNFNDYIIFYEKSSDLNAIRIKDGVTTKISYHTPANEITGLDEYTYAFNVNDKSFCIDGSSYDNGCSEVKYNDPDYVGKYKLGKDDKINLYNNYNKSYISTVFNTFEYKDNYDIYIDEKNNYYYLYGEKDNKRQMIPYIIMSNPAETYKISLKGINTSYTKAKKSVTNTLYNNNINVCVTGAASSSGQLKASCYYPNTAEEIYHLDNKKLNFFNGNKIDDRLYKSSTRFITFTVSFNAFFIAMFYLIFRYLKKSKKNN